MEHSTITHTEHSSHEGSHYGPKEFTIVFAILIGLMIATIVASRYSFGGTLNNVVALIIAIIKATLVVLVFMQVRKGTHLTWVWAAIGFIWLLFLFGTMNDYITREWLSVKGWNP